MRSHRELFQEVEVENSRVGDPPSSSAASRRERNPRGMAGFCRPFLFLLPLATLILLSLPESSYTPQSDDEAAPSMALELLSARYGLDDQVHNNHLSYGSQYRVAPHIQTQNSNGMATVAKSHYTPSRAQALHRASSEAFDTTPVETRVSYDTAPGQTTSGLPPKLVVVNTKPFQHPHRPPSSPVDVVVAGSGGSMGTNIASPSTESGGTFSQGSAQSSQLGGGDIWSAGVAQSRLRVPRNHDDKVERDFHLGDTETELGDDRQSDNQYFGAQASSVGGLHTQESYPSRPSKPGSTSDIKYADGQTGRVTGEQVSGLDFVIPNERTKAFSMAKAAADPGYDRTDTGYTHFRDGTGSPYADYTISVAPATPPALPQNVSF